MTMAFKGVQDEALAEIIRLQREEVAKYRWIESEKAGHDIGEHRALEEWLQNHFAAWASHHKNRAIEEALYAHD